MSVCLANYSCGERVPPTILTAVSTRALSFLVVLGLVVLVGALSSRFLGRSKGEGCPRATPQTELTVLALWDHAGGLTGPAPELEGALPGQHRALVDPDDSGMCQRIRALLPDTLKVGVLAPHSTAFYQVGDVYVVPVIPNLTPSEIESMERGDPFAGRNGTTYVYDADLELLNAYPAY